MVGEERTIREFMNLLDHVYPEFKDFLWELKKRLNERRWRRLILHLDELYRRAFDRGIDFEAERHSDW